jgi:hypothetical protein
LFEIAAVCIHAPDVKHRLAFAEYGGEDYVAAVGAS